MSELEALTQLVSSPGWSLLVIEAQERVAAETEKMEAMKPSEMNLRHWLVRNAKKRELEDLIAWPQARIARLRGK